MLAVMLDEHRDNFWTMTRNVEVLSAAAPGAAATKNGANLLRFYAAEVGLKYLLNHREKIPFLHEIKQDASYKATKKTSVEVKFSHDITSMVAELKVPRGRAPLPPQEPFKCLDTRTFKLEQAHEAWRYGVRVDDADQAALEAYFSGLIQYLEEEIPA